MTRFLLHDLIKYKLPVSYYKLEFRHDVKYMICSFYSIVYVEILILRSCHMMLQFFNTICMVEWKKLKIMQFVLKWKKNRYWLRALRLPLKLISLFQKNL